MNVIRKIPGSLFVLSLLLLSIVGSASAQTGDATGAVELRVVECSSIANHGVLTSVPADCGMAGGTFTFYLRGDGTNDFDQLLVPETDGVATINLAPGSYEVVEENTQTHFDVTVTAGTTTQATFAFASNIIPQPQPPRLYVTSLVCKNYEAASFDMFDGTIPAACDRIGDDVFSLYLYDDGTDDYVQLTSWAGGPAYIDLLPGRYEMVHEGTQMATTVVLTEGEYSIAFFRPAPVDQGVPTPAPTAVAAKTPTPATVSRLPETGVGQDNDIGLMVLAAATGLFLVASSVVQSRRNR